ncbi:hypothetical protein D3C78_1621760 [compost metagenome]
MPFWIAGRADDIGKKLFGAGVAMQHVVFSPFLIIEDKLHRDARLTRPTSMRRTTGVADQITGIIFIEREITHRCFPLPITR